MFCHSQAKSKLKVKLGGLYYQFPHHCHAVAVAAVPLQPGALKPRALKPGASKPARDFTFGIQEGCQDLGS